MRLHHRHDLGVDLPAFILSEVEAQHGQLALVGQVVGVRLKGAEEGGHPIVEVEHGPSLVLLEVGRRDVVHRLLPNLQEVLLARSCGFAQGRVQIPIVAGDNPFGNHQPGLFPLAFAAVCAHLLVRLDVLFPGSFEGWCVTEQLFGGVERKLGCPK